MSAAVSPNADQIALWNDILAPKFVHFRHVMGAAAGAHSGIALARRPVGAGARVLDVGCAFGDTSLELARAVGPRGDVLGVDCCERFLEIARADAAAAGVENARFACADAQTEPFAPAERDLCFSRFGTTFFADPVAAMANLRRAIRPEGRLLMLVWRRADDNPWLAFAREIARAYLPRPDEDGRSGGPGPFSMADPDLVRDLVEGAGWARVEIDRVDADVSIGATVEAAVAFQVTMGPAGQILSEACGVGVARRPQIERVVGERLAPYLAPAGVVLRSSSWCVAARASG